MDAETTGKMHGVFEEVVTRASDARRQLEEEARKRLAEKAKEAIERAIQDESAETRRERGKALRDAVPRKSLGEWDPPAGRPDPVALLKSQDEQRTQELVPLRHERMGVSAFTFYRGAALIMASDLSMTPATGITVQACGDAHISNFGFFSSPEGRTTFDLNDFDETLPGPWEWDVKRLVTSVEICGRDRGFDKKTRRELDLLCAQTYRASMLDFAKRGNMEVWYAHADVEQLFEAVSSKMSKKDRKRARKGLRKAQAKNSARAVVKLTEMTDEGPRFISDPPIVMPLRDFVDERHLMEVVSVIGQIFSRYRATLEPDKRNLLGQYRPVDVAHKVVGVGSVGTQAWVVLLVGARPDDYLVLQIKEAQASVLERFCGASSAAMHGERVVAGQRAIQSTADVMLGWTSARLPGEEGHDFYVRQLWNGKGSVDLDIISPVELKNFSCAAAWTLARSHARTGDRFAIAGYLGKGDAFDRAMAKFACSYADQNEADYARFMQAVESGEL